MFLQNLISLLSQSSQVSQCSDPPLNDGQPFFVILEAAQDVIFNVGYCRNSPFIRMIGLPDHPNYQYSLCGRLLPGSGKKILYDIHRNPIFTIHPNEHLGTKALVLNVMQTGRQFRICKQRAISRLLSSDIVITEVASNNATQRPCTRRHDGNQVQVIIRTDVIERRASIIDQLSQRTVCTIHLKHHKSSGFLVDSLTVHNGAEVEFVIILALCRDEICSLSYGR